MKAILLIGFLFSSFPFCFSQKIDVIINAKEVERIEKVLSADAMKGRKTFSPEIDTAASFIAAEFKAIGLQTLPKENAYKQTFEMVNAKVVSAAATLDSIAIEEKEIIAISAQPLLKINTLSPFEKATINAGSNLLKEAARYTQQHKNYLVWVDASFSKTFYTLHRLQKNIFTTDNSTVFILTTTAPIKYNIEITQHITSSKMANVVAILPGKSKKEEMVVFSGHYDHIGVNQGANNDDSIYNGANDDAAGTTAVIMLAKYFKAKGDNERTIVFAAFTAEEIGGYGSQYFSRQLQADKVVAMFNIEMIGTSSKWGNNSAYITGYEKTDMGKILEKNLKGTAFKFYADPYTTQNLFYRSDNATLAKLGVPAHTISTSKMDDEPNYHKTSDEIETLDLSNMAMVIKAIALSAKTIICGKDTPTRINIEALK